MRNLLVHTGVCEAPLGNIFSSEDHLLEKSNHLCTYTNELRQWWQKTSPASEAECKLVEARLLRELGQALLRTVDRRGQKPCVLKTPSTENIDKFFQLFGNQRMLLVVRDGRDVCESMVQSGFVDSYENTFELWKRNAQSMLDFLGPLKGQAEASRIHLVRYEDAVADPDLVMGSVIEWLGLEIKKYKFDNLKFLPVVGSSELGKTSTGVFEYKTVAKPAGFNPFKRWKNWSAERKDSFKRIANEQLVELGYESGDDW